jgi:type I restriction enzyme S subunit
MADESITGPVPSGWELTTLGDIVERGGGHVQTGPFGSQLHASDYVPVGVPSIMPVNIGDNRIIEEGIARITEDDAERLSRHRVLAGDIIYSRRGDVERRALIRPEQEGWLCGTGCLNVRLGNGGVDPRFVSYYLGHPEVRAWILRHAVGATMPNLNTSIMKAIPLLVPPLEEQQAIACILGALDDKIELNRRINETLETMARTIFKSWFVDFDPVRAKATGQQPSGLAPHIADLFPDEFEESSLGLIPAVWRVDTILTIGELLSGGTPRTKIPEYWNGDVKWVSAKDVSGAQGTFLLDTERTITQEGVENSSTKILPELTTIVTARGTVGSYCILAEPMAMNQTNYGLKAMSQDADYFVFFALGNLVSQLKQRAYGTIFDTVTTRTFETTQIVVPGDAVITKFDQHIRPLMEKIRQNLRQSRTLAALRDTLLPRLISGELRVPDAEKVVARTL